jgi:hypothetical protein
MADFRRLFGTTLAAAALAGVAAVHPAASAPSVHSVGAITRHAAKFIGRDVAMHGYLLARKHGYILFSDEPGGRIGRYDLPVTGTGIDTIVPRKRYVIQGTFLDHGLKASNGNPDHLQLSKPPQLAGS